MRILNLKKMRPLKSKNHSFTSKVLSVVSKIPRGQVLTYQEVARRAGSPRACRAVGNILHKNRDPHVFCHRVIRSNGQIGGFAGGTKQKIKLLKQEGFIK